MGPILKSNESGIPCTGGGRGSYMLGDDVVVNITLHGSPDISASAPTCIVRGYDVQVTHAPDWTAVSVIPVLDGPEQDGPNRNLQRVWQVVFRTPTGALRSYEISPWHHLAELGLRLQCDPASCAVPVLEVAP